MGKRTRNQRQRNQRHRREDSRRRSSLGFYLLVLLGTLALTGVLHGLLIVLLPLIDTSGLTRPLLTGLFAIAYGWMLSGLSVALLLAIWQRSRFFGVVVGLALGAGWILGLSRHIPQRSALLYLAPLALGGLVLYTGLRYGATQLLPIPHRNQSRDAFRLLKAQLGGSGRPGTIVDGGPMIGDETRPFPGEPLERSVDKPSFVITPSHQVVAISDKLQLKGVRGPGLVFLRPGERVDQIIDLRPQERTFELVGRTLDGIEVRVPASVAFQIDAGRRRPMLGTSIPFSRAAAFKAVHAQRVERAGSRQGSGEVRRHLWADLPGVRAEHILRDIVSRMSFDDLYAPHQVKGEPPRSAVARHLSNELHATLKPIGIQLVGVQLGNFEPTDPEVYVKRARSWQAAWMRKVMLTQAEGRVEQLQILEHARADARTELILDVGQKLARLAESQAEPSPDVVLKQFLVVLETLAARPQLTDALPQHTRDVLSDLRQAVEE